MKQQRIGTPRSQMMIFFPRKVDLIIRRIARKKGYSNSGVASELIQDSLRRQGYLKDED